MKYLLNPLNYPVSKVFHLDEKGETYTLPAEKITEFENEVVFNHMRDYLVDIILNERNEWHFDANRARVREEVTKIL